jgi:hypothetical protein
LQVLCDAQITSKAQRPDGKPGRELALRAEVFSVLIFCYFFIKKKVVAPAAMSGREYIK